MTILVTGATGTVGRRVVHFLAERPLRVRIGVHNPANAAGLLGDNVEAVPFDYLSPESMAQALEGVEKVFFLTPPSLAGVAMAKRAVDVMKGKPIAQVVRLSVQNADRKPAPKLVREHREIERYIEDAGLPATFLRPNFFMDNLLRMAEPIRRQGVVPLAWGDGHVSVIAVSDIGEAAANVLTSTGHVGKAYDFTGPEALTGEMIAGFFSEILGRTIRYQPLSDAQARQQMQGLPEEQISALIELQQSFRANMAAWVDDTLPELLGHPAMTFLDWVRQHAFAFQHGESRAA